MERIRHENNGHILAEMGYFRHLYSRRIIQWALWYYLICNLAVDANVIDHSFATVTSYICTGVIMLHTFSMTFYKGNTVENMGILKSVFLRELF